MLTQHQMFLFCPADVQCLHSVGAEKAVVGSAIISLEALSKSLPF